MRIRLAVAPDGAEYLASGVTKQNARAILSRRIVKQPKTAERAACELHQNQIKIHMSWLGRGFSEEELLQDVQVLDPSRCQAF